MKSISPYQLWKFIDEPIMSCTDGSHKYADYRLGKLLESNGMKLKSVTITNDIETYDNIDDLHYLRAHVSIDHNGEEIVMDLKPRYAGDDDEWALLMMDKQVDDIDIRFSLGDNKFQPLWFAVIEGDRRVLLSGDRIDWDVLYSLDADLSRGTDDYICHYFVDSEEMNDLSEEAFNPDWTPQEEGWR